MNLMIFSIFGTLISSRISSQFGRRAGSMGDLSAIVCIVGREAGREFDENPNSRQATSQMVA
jgi:hypothetical protein